MIEWRGKNEKTLPHTQKNQQKRQNTKKERKNDSIKSKRKIHKNKDGIKIFT